MDSDHQQKVTLAKKEAEGKLRSLAEELNKIRQFDEPTYEVVSDRGYRGLDYKLEALDPQTQISYSDYVRVYVERVTARFSSYDVGKFFIRIECNIGRFEHKRNWTFESVDLATKVHLKVIDIVSQCRAARKAYQDHQTAVEVGTKSTEKHFPNHIHEIYARQGGLSVRLSKDVTNAYTDRVELERRLSSGFYTVKETPELTADQMNRILAIIWEEKNERPA